MRSWLATILVFLVSAPLLAQTGEPQTSTTTTTTTTTTAAPKTPKQRAAATPKAPARPTTASEIKTLREAVSTQQQQIQMLRDELQRRDAAMQQVQQQLNQLQSTAQQAQTTAQTAATTSQENQAKLANLTTSVGTVETTAKTTATSLQAAEKSIKALESPLAIKYKGITITPGGFITANGIWRQHNQNTDNQGVFGAIPFEGSSNAHQSEFRLSTRYSRLSLLALGKTKTFDAQGYFEIDFQGAAQTANETLTNSFQPRIRELWANVDAPHGLSFSAGQGWSLMTPHRTGIGPRGLLLPAMIDGSLVVGYHYARQTNFRVRKGWDLANKKKLYLAFAIENPETTSQGAVPAGLTVFGLQGNAAVSLGGGTNPTATTPNGSFATGVSVDAAPDLVAKIAIEPGWGHFELAGVGRIFRNRVAVTANTGTVSAGTNHTTLGGGLSFNGLLPIVPKKVDIWFSTLAGRGIGRFGPALGPDVTIRPNGSLQPILAYEGFLGLEVKPTPTLDLFLYGGSEYWKRSPYYTGGTALLPTGVGFGLVSADLRACQVEIPIAGTACAPSNKNVYEITPGFWYRFYRGPAGTLQYGMWYEHIRRTTWTGRLDATGATQGSIHATQNLVMTSFRWYFP